MANDMKTAYRTIMEDHFPPEMKISFGDQALIYRKRAWKITDEDSGERVEKGLRSRRGNRRIIGNRDRGMKLHAQR